MAVVPEYVAAGCKVIDLSADYRLNDPPCTRNGTATFTPIRLDWVDSYGLPELFAEQIKTADLVAIPAAIPAPRFSTGPAICGGIVEPTGIIIDAKAVSVERVARQS